MTEQPEQEQAKPVRRHAVVDMNGHKVRVDGFWTWREDDQVSFKVSGRITGPNHEASE